MSNHLPYVSSLIQKIEERNKQKELLNQELLERVQLAANIIGQKYNIKRIYIFGSIIHPDLFRLTSDVDIAIEGIDSRDYLDIWGEFEEILDHPFDLVQLERTSQSLRRVILEEGRVIYEG